MDEIRIGIPLERVREKNVKIKTLDIRRKSRRYIVRTGPLVLLHPTGLLNLIRPGYIELGPVINISKGGLMVQFIVNKYRDRDRGLLSISLPGQNLKVIKVPFHVVADFKVAELPDGRVVRNRSIKFGQLNKVQLFQLKEFMKGHTSGFQNDRRNGMERRRFDRPEYNNDEWQIKKDRRRGLERRKYPAVDAL